MQMDSLKITIRYVQIYVHIYPYRLLSSYISASKMYVEKNRCTPSCFVVINYHDFILYAQAYEDFAQKNIGIERYTRLGQTGFGEAMYHQLCCQRLEVLSYFTIILNLDDTGLENFQDKLNMSYPHYDFSFIK